MSRRVAAVLLLVRGAGLAGDAIAHDLRARRGAAGLHRQLQHARAPRAPSPARSRACRRGGASRLQERQRHQLAVAGEHRVGARQLQQATPRCRGRRPSSPARSAARSSQGRSRAARLARESRVCGAAPKPTRVNSVPHAPRRGSASAILAAPTLEDFWITCATVSAPLGMRVADGRSRRCVSVPGAVWIVRLRRHAARLERRGDGERLQRRARLEQCR